MYYLFLLLIPIVFIASWFFASFYINAAMFAPEKATAVSNCKKVFFKSGKNKLVGYWFNETGRRGIVVFAHGMGTDINYYMPEIRRFEKAGFRVFAFEYSGYGESDGRFLGFSQAVIDLKNAIEFAYDDSLPVVLVGHSMGAYAVCAVPNILKQKVSAVVAYAPFNSPKETILELIGRQSKNKQLLRATVLPMQRILFRNNFSLTAVDGLTRINSSTLVLQGNNDKEVTVNGCSLYAKRNDLSGTNIRFDLIDDADGNGHLTIIRPKNSTEVNEFTMRKVEEFLSNV